MKQRSWNTRTKACVIYLSSREEDERIHRSNRTFSLHQRDHQSLIIPTRLTPHPLCQLPLMKMPIRPLHLLQMAPIPMQPHQPTHQQHILRAGALHRILQRLRIRLGAIHTTAQHPQQRILHMARELVRNDLSKLAMVAGMVGVGDSADLAVRAMGEDSADTRGIRAHLGALGSAMQLSDVLVRLLRVHGRRLVGARARQHHGEQLLRLQREVAADVGFERAVVLALVGGFDGVDVGVAPAEQDVVEEGLFGAEARDGFVEEVDVLFERPAGEAEEAVAEVAARFFVDVFEKVAVEALVKGLAECGHLEGVGSAEDLDQGGFVCAEALHGAA